LGGKKRKRKILKREMARGLFLTSQTCLAGCAAWDFHGCLVQLKAYLSISLCILCAPNIVLARSNQNYLSVVLMFQGGF
jgi:hypothetical protein